MFHTTICRSPEVPGNEQCGGLPPGNLPKEPRSSGFDLSRESGPGSALRVHTAPTVSIPAPEVIPPKRSLLGRIGNCIGNFSGPFVAGLGSTVIASVNTPIGAGFFAVIAGLGLYNEVRSARKARDKSEGTIDRQNTDPTPTNLKWYEKSPSLNWFIKSPGLNSSLCAANFVACAVELFCRKGLSDLPLIGIYLSFTVGLIAVARVTNIGNSYDPLPVNSLLKKIKDPVKELCPENLLKVLKDMGPWFALGNFGVNAMFLGGLLKVGASIVQGNVSSASTLIGTGCAVLGGAALCHAAIIGFLPLFGFKQRPGHSASGTGAGDIAIGVGSVVLGNPVVGFGTNLYGISNLLFGYQARERARAGKSN